MAGNSGDFIILSIDINGMLIPFAKKHTLLRFEMPNKIAAFHAAVISNGSRMTFSPRIDSSEIILFASRTNSTVSLRFFLASSSVLPWVFGPG
jgi:hypothetical protein